IGLETPTNALLVMWMGFFLWMISGWKLERYRRQEIIAQSGANALKHAVLLATALVCLLPLLVPIIKMARHGEYPRQTILWKTHRTGANLLSLLMPNPLHALWGPAVSRWFTSRGLIVQDQAAGLGWVWLTLIVISRPWNLGRSAKRWIALGAASTVLAMGPYLHIAQHNLWLTLPFYFL